MLQSEFSGKPINKVSPFCPRATAEGMVGSGSAARFLTWKQGRKLYGSTVRVVQEQVLYLSAGSLSNRKDGTDGQKGVCKTTRTPESGPCPKDREDQCTPRGPPRWKECTASGKKINLLFWNMNTYGGRKPR